MNKYIIRFQARDEHIALATRFLLIEFGCHQLGISS
jgi:hypothetical protein